MDRDSLSKEPSHAGQNAERPKMQEMSGTLNQIGKETERARRWWWGRCRRICTIDQSNRLGGEGQSIERRPATLDTMRADEALSRREDVEGGMARWREQRMEEGEKEGCLGGKEERKGSSKGKRCKRGESEQRGPKHQSGTAEKGRVALRC